MANFKRTREIDEERREEASRQGLTHYEPGAPCRHGHVAKRSVRTDACSECKKESRLKPPVRNKELYKESWQELREEAKRLGMNHFFTGRPCKRGHIAKRYVKSGTCIACDQEHWIKWAAANPVKQEEVKRRAHANYKEKYPEKFNEIKKESTLRWRRANWDRLREPNRQACLRFVRRQKEKQFGVPYIPQPCEVCGSSEKPCLDHDHATGKFRGWLCSKCNSVLGYVNDSVDRLQKMIVYLENKR